MDGEILADAARSGARCGSTACVALQLGADLYVAHAGVQRLGLGAEVLSVGPPHPCVACVHQSGGWLTRPLVILAACCMLHSAPAGCRRSYGIFVACPSTCISATAGDSIAVLARNGQAEVLTSKGSHKVTWLLRCAKRSRQLPYLQAPARTSGHGTCCRAALPLHSACSAALGLRLASPTGWPAGGHATTA